MALALGASRRGATLIVASCFVAGMTAASLEAARGTAVAAAPVPAGEVGIAAVAVTDPHRFRDETAMLVRPMVVRQGGGWSAWEGPVLLLAGASDAVAGEYIMATGNIDPRLDVYRGRPVGGVMRAHDIRRLRDAANPVLAVGNLLRRRILGSLDEASRQPAGALLLGFLIGDVRMLPDSDAIALRASGLSHFVAVSGSNVALFLGAWWLVGGPLAYGPRRRALFGLAGLVVFVVLTRWEPSVVRAAVMAGLVLVANLTGRPITPWTALGGAVALSLGVAPGLAGDVGFALSAAATAGIICGAPLWRGRRPAVLWTVLGATVSAQLAVAPLLLVWFGSVPLLSPVANLLATPIVAAATMIGGAGAVIGWEPPVAAGTGLAGLVLIVARLTSDLPQLTAGWVLPSLGLLAVSIRFRSIRPVAFVVVAVATAIALLPPRLPRIATAHFLDVGQGDATLFRGPRGETILVDGGPDPTRLRILLADFGVRRIDLLVVSHGHADHIGGLFRLVESVAIGSIWHPAQTGTSALESLLNEAAAAGTPASSPPVGTSAVLGTFTVEVLAPKRKYAAINDGSLVVSVHAAGTTVVMAGDTERSAQSDLGPLRGDVLKVPHQGAATSDPVWLASSAPLLAVISVGENQFGHPSPEVIQVLEENGARVLRTDESGTITIPFDRVETMAAGLPSRP